MVLQQNREPSQRLLRQRPRHDHDDRTPTTSAINFCTSQNAICLQKFGPKRPAKSLPSRKCPQQHKRTCNRSTQIVWLTRTHSTHSTTRMHSLPTTQRTVHHWRRRTTTANKTEAKEDTATHSKAQQLDQRNTRQSGLGGVPSGPTKVHQPSIHHPIHTRMATNPTTTTPVSSCTK